MKMVKNYGESAGINHNPGWPYIPDHPYRILIIGGLKHQRPDIDEIYLYIKDSLESKYQLLINGEKK